MASTSSGNSSLDKLISFWKHDSSIQESVVRWEEVPEKASQFSSFPENLSPEIIEQLEANNIHLLYIHQRDAIDCINQGKNIIISTGTSSGKSLCYTLPALDRLLKNPDTCSLFLFPTKALTYDQLNNLKSFAPLKLRDAISVYDGDTPSSLRSTIRKNARILLTNPDMLHLGILPHHTNWANFFNKLHLIVLDEIHIYRGIFGSHLANLIRRLKRIANFYGSQPQFILTSATIANPLEFGSRLLEVDINLIDSDGAPHGAKHWLMYNPPVVNKELGIRRSALSESTRFCKDLFAYDLQTLLFTGTRPATEQALKILHEQLPGESKHFFSYRSGYLPTERRQIEQALKDGTARVVTATNALELGIDIGSMQAVVISGYPGTIAATRQQSGRAGRKTESSIAILVASANPLDQYLVRHSDYIFERSPEKALINPNNPIILLKHLTCALFELPFTDGDKFGGLGWEEIHPYLEALTQMGLVHHSKIRFTWTADQYPSQQISLRSGSASTILLQVEENGVHTTLGSVDKESANWMVHPGAIYLHQAQTYLVKELNLDEQKALLIPYKSDYFTEAVMHEGIKLLSVIKSKSEIGCEIKLGEVLVNTQLRGYRKLHWYTREYLGAEEITLPPTELRTVAFLLRISQDTVNQLQSINQWSAAPINYGTDWEVQRLIALRRDQFTCQNCGISGGRLTLQVHHKIPFRQFTSHLQANHLENLVTLCPSCHRLAESAVRIRSGLAGVSYLLKNLSPLFLMCDPSDLGSHADPQSSISDGDPVIIIYDNVPAGIGLADQIFDEYIDILQAAMDQVTHCPCEDGCPSCVGAAGAAESGGKIESKALLSLLNGKPVLI